MGCWQPEVGMQPQPARMSAHSVVQPQLQLTTLFCRCFACPIGAACEVWRAGAVAVVCRFGLHVWPQLHVQLQPCIRISCNTGACRRACLQANQCTYACKIPTRVRTSKLLFQEGSLPPQRRCSPGKPNRLLLNSKSRVVGFGEAGWLQGGRL